MPPSRRKIAVVRRQRDDVMLDDINADDTDLSDAAKALSESGMLMLDDGFNELQYSLAEAKDGSGSEASNIIMPLQPLWGFGGDLKFATVGTFALITGASGVGKSALCGSMAQWRVEKFREYVPIYSPETVDERGIIPSIRSVVMNTEAQDGVMSFSSMRAWDIVKALQEKEIEGLDIDVRALLDAHMPTKEQIIATVDAAERIKRKWRGKIGYVRPGKHDAKSIIASMTKSIKVAREHGLVVRQAYIDYLQDIVSPQAVSKGSYPNYEHTLSELVDWAVRMNIHLVIFSQMRKGDAMIAKTQGDAELDAIAGASENKAKLHILLTQDQDDDSVLTGMIRLRVTKNNVGRTMRGEYALLRAELERFRYNLDITATMVTRKKVKRDARRNS